MRGDRRYNSGMYEPKCERQSAAFLDDEQYLRAPNQDEAIEVNIIGDDHLERQGRAVHVAPAVLALNGLLMCRREGYVPAQTIRDRVGYDASHSSFREDMDTISEALIKLTSVPEALSRPGTSRAKRYHLSDLLDFIDRRQDAMDDPMLRPLFFDLIGEVPALDDFQDGRLEFESSDARRRAFAAMLREVSTQPSVRWFGQQLSKGKLSYQITDEALEEDCRLMERALVAYMQPDYALERYKDTLVGGAMAFQELLFSTLRRADTLAYQMTESKEGRLKKDLFQSAAESLMEHIMTFDKTDLDWGTLTQFFYGRMKKVMYGSMTHQLEEERWSSLGVSERKRRLIRRIQKESDELQQELQREPSPAEIADKLKADVDDVDEALYMMERTNHSIDQEYFRGGDGNFQDIEYAMHRLHGVDEIEETIDHLDRKNQIDVVFGSDQLKERDKIALSVFYGVYVPSLARCRFTKGTHENKECFVYPDSLDDFNAAITAAEGSFKSTAALLGFDRVRLSHLIAGALATSRQVLKKESSVSDW